MKSQNKLEGFTIEELTRMKDLFESFDYMMVKRLFKSIADDMVIDSFPKQYILEEERLGLATRQGKVDMLRRDWGKLIGKELEFRKSQKAKNEVPIIDALSYNPSSVDKSILGN
jgi:hypothetical protein